MIKKIDVTQLRKGMFICGTERKWMLPFFHRKFIITSDKQINTLRAYCEFVVIDTKKGVDVISRAEAEIEQYHNETTIEIDRSKQIHENNLYRIMIENVLKTTRSSYE